MKILVIGGTGAMGAPLVDQLSSMDRMEIIVTSRSSKESTNNITFIKGDAHKETFLKELLSTKYDAIFDFMVYDFEEMKKILPFFLENTQQYFFFSSSRVYANSSTPITEESARLLDVCKDQAYLSTGEYALAKAREEDLLFNSKSKNWTIIRPYITYNSDRLQLGVYEKEQWLFRALRGRTVVFPKDIAEKRTSLTYGPDVAKEIIPLIGNKKAMGEAFHVVTKEQMIWQQILNIYKEVIEEEIGLKIRVIEPDSSAELQRVWHSSAQIKYDRLFNRSFNSTKLIETVGEVDFLSIHDGIQKCMREFLKNPKWRTMNAKYEAWADRLTGEHTPLKDIPSKKGKLVYLKNRYL
jgi:nucleoside-diphosphate-sugar epimerase